MTNSKFAKELLEIYNFNDYYKGRDIVVFPKIEGTRLANPLRILLLKIMTNNPYLEVMTPDNFDGVDVVRKYLNVLDYGGNRGRMSCIFVNDKVIWIDNFDQSYWKHCSIGRLLGRHGQVVDGCIKLQCAPGCYKGVPYPVYPFIYPGPNDYIQDKEKYPVTYSDSHYYEFRKCCEENSFDNTVFARWSNFGQRPKFTKLCKQIEGANVSGEKMGWEEFIKNMSRSKFCIAARGNGKWSHREMEICSIGCPLLSTDNGGIMWKPFVAGKHYIEITLKNFLETFHYYDEHYDEALTIAARGKEYFDLYHRQPGVQLIFKEIVDTILGRRPWKQV